MSERATRWAIGLTLAGVAALIATLLAVFGERRTREVDVGFQGEAAINPLLAAERVLTRLGMPATSQAALGPLPPTDTLLLMRDNGAYLTPQTIARLVDWVERGGHLIALAPSSTKRKATPADGEREPEEQDEDDEEDDDASPRFVMPIAEAFGAHCTVDEELPRAGELDGDGFEGERFDVAFECDFAFTDPDRLADLVGGEVEGARLMSFALGPGRATFVVDSAWASNASIDERDHARFLWFLASYQGPRAAALIVYGSRPPGLMATIWKHGWTVVIAGAVALALALWRAAARFGPLLPALSHDRRDFSEHVIASGEFLWRHRASDALLAAPHAELRRRIALARPDWAALDTPDLATALAEQSGLERERALRALRTEHTDDPTLFVGVVQDLERLRKAL